MQKLYEYNFGVVRGVLFVIEILKYFVKMDEDQ